MRKGLLASFVLVVIALIGCSKADPINETHNGTLQQGDKVYEQDQSLYDEYKFKAEQGYNITVTMRSDALDSYLHLYGPDGSQLATNDDSPAAGGKNAQIQMAAPASGEYTVYANSLNQGETGAYSVNIVTTAGQ